jgi:uncharacterized protein GlcG (DUF336 family)
MPVSLTKKTIDIASAERIMKGAVAKAAELGKPMCIAITNEAGQLKLFQSMDGAPHLSTDIAQNKAYTSSAFGLPTHVWYDFIKNDPPLLHGITHTPRLVIFGGGYPIKEGNELIGAIGVSGGHYSDDMEVARAGLQAGGFEVQ